jgi:hypothetical protein
MTSPTDFDPYQVKVSALIDRVNTPPKNWSMQQQWLDISHLMHLKRQLPDAIPLTMEELQNKLNALDVAKLTR